MYLQFIWGEDFSLEKSELRSMSWQWGRFLHCFCGFFLMITDIFQNWYKHEIVKNKKGHIGTYIGIPWILSSMWLEAKYLLFIFCTSAHLLSEGDRDENVATQIY